MKNYFGKILIAAVVVALILPLSLWVLTPSELKLPTLVSYRVNHNYPLITPRHIPDKLDKSLIAVEDERYFQHHGIDSYGLARALWHDLKGMCLCEGGSTLTQQLVKMTYYPSTPALIRKIPGTTIALKIETRYSKKEILANYLNIVPMGANVTGANEASCLYFGHSPANLTWAEAALLAGTPNAPSAYDPRFHPSAAMQRRHHVLVRLEALKYITSNQRYVADNAPLITPSDQPCAP